MNNKSKISQPPKWEKYKWWSDVILVLLSHFSTSSVLILMSSSFLLRIENKYISISLFIILLSIALTYNISNAFSFSVKILDKIEEKWCYVVIFVLAHCMPTILLSAYFIVSLKNS